MKTFLFAAIVLVLLLAAACAPGASSTVPPEVATGAAQAPTVGASAATSVSGAVNAAATQAAQAAPTLIPPAQTAAVTVQTEVANAGKTAVPAAQTAVGAAQTAVATAVAPLLGSTPAPGGTTLDAKLSEYKIDMPTTTVKAGLVNFRVTNSGTIEHNFQVDGQGVLKNFDNNLKPGETETLQVTLQPGTFKVYCTLDGHKDLGMLVNLTVTP